MGSTGPCRWGPIAPTLLEFLCYRHKFHMPQPSWVSESHLKILISYRLSFLVFILVVSFLASCKLEEELKYLYFLLYRCFI